MASFIALQLGGKAEFLNTMKARALIGLPVSICLYFPLCFVRDLSAVRYGGLFTVISLIYIGLVLAVESPAYYKQNIDKESTIIKWAYLDWNIFTTCAVTFFSYTC